MRQLVRLSILAGIMISLSGCAYWTHYTRNDSIASEGRPGSALIVDAKQRMVFSTRTKEQIRLKEADPNESLMTREQYRICAEPSPDALSAIASSLGLSYGSEARNIALSQSIAESAGSIGLRTQSIQLMRDAMYRLCEGYISGALSASSYETMLRRFQTSMVAILAIEQLTGAVRGPNLVLGGEASVGAAELVDKYTEKAIEAKQKLTAAEKTESTLKAQTEAAKAAAEKEKVGDENVARLEELTKKDELNEDEKKEKADLEKKKTQSEELNKTAVETTQKYESSKDETQKWKAALSAYEKARVAAIGGTTKAAGGGAAVSFTSNVSPEAIEKVSLSVERISTIAMEKSFSNELCVTVLLAQDDSIAIRAEARPSGGQPSPVNAETQDEDDGSETDTENSTSNPSTGTGQAPTGLGAVGSRLDIKAKCAKFLDDSIEFLAQKKTLQAPTIKAYKALVDCEVSVLKGVGESDKCDPLRRLLGVESVAASGDRGSNQPVASNASARLPTIPDLLNPSGSVLLQAGPENRRLAPASVFSP